VVKPSHRREIAKHSVATKNISIHLSCEAFMISETCYRYQAKLSDDNIRIADWH
jgi:putative transposase